MASTPSPPQMMSEREDRVRRKAACLQFAARFFTNPQKVPSRSIRKLCDTQLIPLAVAGLLLEVPTWTSFCRLMAASIDGDFPRTCTAGGPFPPEAKHHLRELCELGIVPLFHQASHEDTFASETGMHRCRVSKRGSIEFLYPVGCGTRYPCQHSRCHHTRSHLASFISALKEREGLKVYVQ